MYFGDGVWVYSTKERRLGLYVGGANQDDPLCIYLESYSDDETVGVGGRYEDAKGSFSATLLSVIIFMLGNFANCFFTSSNPHYKTHNI